MSSDEHEEQLNLLQTITMEVAAAGDTRSALEIVLRRVCEKTNWALGQAWLPNKGKTFLEYGPVWLCGGPELADFRAASEKYQFRSGVGLPGRVWQTKTAAWIEDVRDDENFPRAEAAKALGLKSAVGIPILSGDEVIAVIEFFMREPRHESEQLVRVISAVAAQLDLVIERKFAAAELSRTSEILHSILSDMGDAVIVADREGSLLVFNPAAEQMFGSKAGQVGLAQWPRQ